MKKLVLFSAMLFSAWMGFAQAPKTTLSKHVTMTSSGGYYSSNGCNSGPPVYSGGHTWTNGYGGMNGSGGSGSGHGHGHGHGHGGGHGSGSGHGHGGHHGHGGQGHNSGCNAGNGSSGFGQNGYYGGQNGTVYYGNGNGTSYSGCVTTTPAVPLCGMCSGYHAMNIVCEREFSSISGAIYNRTFESDKLLVAKQATGGKLLSADQVRRLTGLFTFESTKLEFAKWAYRNTWDPQNYYVVNDAFTFSSSIRELDEFIRRG